MLKMLNREMLSSDSSNYCGIALSSLVWRCCANIGLLLRGMLVASKPHLVFTTRCYARARYCYKLFVGPSARDVEVGLSWSHRLEIFRGTARLSC